MEFSTTLFEDDEADENRGLSRPCHETRLSVPTDGPPDTGLDDDDDDDDDEVDVMTP